MCRRKLIDLVSPVLRVYRVYLCSRLTVEDEDSRSFLGLGPCSREVTTPRLSLLQCSFSGFQWGRK